MHATCGRVLYALAMGSIIGAVACGGSEKPANGPADQSSKTTPADSTQTTSGETRPSEPPKGDPLAEDASPPPDKTAKAAEDKPAPADKKPAPKNVTVSVTSGKSCEKAMEENPQTLDMGKGGGGGQRDLTDAELGAPLENGQFMANCGLADSANAEICVAVKGGKPLGVTVKVSPGNGQVQACIEKATRRVLFPANPKLDVVHERF